MLNVKKVFIFYTDTVQIIFTLEPLTLEIFKTN